MKAENTKDESRSDNQAQAQYEGICEMVAALECDYDRLEELKTEREGLLEQTEELKTWDEENGEELKELTEAAGDCENREDAEQRIQEDPLSVEVRSDWHGPGENGEDTEFTILLCTGGPAVRIIGELDGGEPCRAWLEHQDWGTPWQQHYISGAQETLLTYCRQFYFGA